ncbi:proline-rich membrane anchor 1 isoform X2 [Stegostoma tigrinum]|uniref:proline-rich membrane anchor 1 isoform X2 n=1 Tax=Stegostoma tigrinum TaxID=3053191 RepID=UPI0028706450|nr:proline-rich membrane anchor 1 isoform X2 [Stegostoma tigrinum]
MMNAELSLTLCPWILKRYFLASLIFFFQLSQGQLQKSGGRSVFETGTDDCHEICSCRLPPLPPPPPPPPPPRQFVFPTVKPTDYPPLKPWWTDIVILIAVSCAILAFLVIAVIICYKAIKSVYFFSCVSSPYIMK